MRDEMDINVNIRLDEAMKSYVQELCFRSGFSTSELIRQALLLAGPQILASPDYASRVSLCDVEISNILARQE